MRQDNSPNPGIHCEFGIYGLLSFLSGTMAHFYTSLLTPTFNETILPIAMEDYKEDPQFLFYGQECQKEPTNSDGVITNSLPEASLPQYKERTFL